MPTIVALRERFDAVRAGETERVMAKLEHLNERDRKLVEQYGEALVNKLLHGPMAQLRQTGAGERGVQLAGALRILFRLEDAAGAAHAGEESREGAPAEPGPGEPGA